MTAMRRDTDILSKLKLAEDRWRMLAETARVFIAYLTTDTVVSYVNSYASQISGYSIDEVIGKRFTDIFVAADSRDHVAREMEGVAAGKHVIGCEGVLTTKGGTEREMLWNAAPARQSDSQPPLLVLTGVDITELRQAQEALRESEERYRSVVDHSLAGVFIVHNNRFVYANKRAEELAGYTLEDMRDRDFWEIAHPDDQEFIKDRAERRLRGEPVPERYECRFVDKSGNVRTVEIWAAPITYDGDKAILGNVVDITDRVKAEEARIQAERELERSKRQLYREAISALTRGKLEILEPEETGQYLIGAQISADIWEPREVTQSRRLVRDLAYGAGLSGVRLDEFLLAEGEAAVNALKHAGGGRVLAGIRDGTVWAGVVDDGPGIDTFVLTQAVFSRGYSTKPSLGLGFTLILGGADRVLLSTSPQGTTVIVEKCLVEPPPAPGIDLSRIPDLWEGSSRIRVLRGPD